MSTLFGSTGTGLFGNTNTNTQVAQSGLNAVGGNNENPMKDFLVNQPPDDTLTALRFSPASVSSTFLTSTSWDNRVRCWEINQIAGTANPKAEQVLNSPLLDCCWHADGTKIFTADCEKQAKVWDLASNQIVQVAEHGAPIKSVRWIQSPQYSCLVTGSWDKTVKFWDTKSPTPIFTIQLTERLYCADIMYPMAVFTTADRGIVVYSLEGGPKEYKKFDSPLKYQHRCVSIFKDANGGPTGFALGSIEGRVAIQYAEGKDPKDNFTFKCHRSNAVNNVQDIYAVNDIAFHPTHNTLVTVGSDGRFSFWDKDARTKIKTSEQFPLPLTSCAFSHDGKILAYAIGYDWSKGHEGNDVSKKSKIFLRPAEEEMKPRAKTK
ncbi:protein Rae1-like [Symsagittifera roscoffensis]|uniref:protein Rae1-like n=1 Tax=Symsagittifera roscoffensis TaxID=84072 RepID=UPI00307B7528